MKERLPTRPATALLLAATLSIACGTPGSDDDDDAAEIPEDASVATFAGGCFWCMEPPFEKLDGVYEVISGYTGGTEIDPTYEQVSSGLTGHAEAIRVYYDPSRVTYDRLLHVYWRQIDPTDPNGQFVDRGMQYRTAIFWHDEAQRLAAEASRDALDRSGRFNVPIVTQIVETGPFYRAEEYHQDFYRKSSRRYKSYRWGSGRDDYIARVWGGDE